LKLLFFIQSLGGGGAERVTTSLANHWARRGWEVTVVTVAPLSEDAYVLHPAVQRVSLGLAGDSANRLIGLIRNWRRIRLLRQILKRTKPEVAVAMMTTANIVLALAARRLSDIVVVGSERIHPPRYPLGWLWEALRRYSYSALDSVVALTAESAHWIRRNTRARRVDVIPNPANWPLDVQSPTVRPETVIAAGRKMVLAVGRLDVQKGFDCLIDAFAEIAPRHADWDLVILGEGGARNGLEARVRATGLDSRVRLPGRAGNVADWYERADLFVLSSRFEGFPNALVEAMMHGVPCVSFDCETGPKDIIRHEVDGLLVPLGDVGQLVRAMDRLIRDDELRGRLGRAAVDVKDRLAIEKVAEQWITLFGQLSSENPRTRNPAR
jgi:glycosyltransferase involved in cell wall biosynthesis